MKVVSARRTIELVLTGLCAAAAPGLAAAYQSEQGFFRVVEGDATLVRIESGEPERARENTPALVGDRVWLAPGARVEVILPDGHRLRLGASADLELLELARSLEEESETTVLRLRSGALAVDVPREPLGSTRVDTDNATLSLEPDGLYLVEADEAGYTRVVVRAGRAELVTVTDAVTVAAGEQAEASPDPSSRVALYEAPQLTEVELWAETLEAEAARADLDGLEPELRYAALPLARHGAWIDTAGGYAWRPRVTAGWQPYWNGYWTYSPAGLVWSSHEPWGWVPYHYGTWDLHPTYGWLWHPGVAYAPAHVVWYWGPSHAAWIPAGYYRAHYARRFGFHVSFGAGFHGVSYANWPAYRHWTFCPVSSIGFSHQYRFHRDHRVLAHDRFAGHRRGFITADTRGLDRGRWRDAGAVERAVLRSAHRRTGSAPRLADVSAVIARSPEVSSSLLRELDQERGVRRVATHRPTGGGATSVDASPRPGARAHPQSPRGADTAAAVVDRQADGASGSRRALQRSPAGAAGTAAPTGAVGAAPQVGGARQAYPHRAASAGVDRRGSTALRSVPLDRQRERSTAGASSPRERAIARRPAAAPPAATDHAVRPVVRPVLRSLPSERQSPAPASPRAARPTQPQRAPVQRAPVRATQPSAAPHRRPPTGAVRAPAVDRRSSALRAAPSAPRVLAPASRSGGRPTAATPSQRPAPRVVESSRPAPSARGSEAPGRGREAQPRQTTTRAAGSGSRGGRHARPH